MTIKDMMLVIAVVVSLFFAYDEWGLVGLVLAALFHIVVQVVTAIADIELNRHQGVDNW